MRLINLQTHKLEEFTDSNIPPYAILSHTWGDGEVTFQDVQILSAAELEKKAGWKKIVGFCNNVLFCRPPWRLDVKHGWVDTCCIDKTSSAELSEAINSMFRWYKNAAWCVAYLTDVVSEDSLDASGLRGEDTTPLTTQLKGSRWFTRGWTLQELLAPKQLDFYDSEWKFISTKARLAPLIASVTNIDENTITTGAWSATNVAQRMSWASGRQTTRIEDLAYCLLGLFDVNMPLLYGEGDRAFVRLQEEILKETDDHSIFAWDASDKEPTIESVGVFATHPSQFRAAGNVESYPPKTPPTVITNKGIQITIPIIQEQNAPKSEFLGVLSCSFHGDLGTSLCIRVKPSDLMDNPPTSFSRTRDAPISLGLKNLRALTPNTIFLAKRDRLAEPDEVPGCWICGSPSPGYNLVTAMPVEKWNLKTQRTVYTATEDIMSCHVAAFRREDSGETEVLQLILFTRKPRGGVARRVKLADNLNELGLRTELNDMLHKLRQASVDWRVLSNWMVTHGYGKVGMEDIRGKTFYVVRFGNMSLHGMPEVRS